MKFLAGFITATLISLILVISAWLYFDLPIDTNNETQETTPTKQVQQQKYTDHIQASSPTRPVAESSLYLTDEETSELNQLKNKMDDQQLDQEENERFEYLTTRDNARKQMEGNTNE